MVSPLLSVCLVYTWTCTMSLLLWQPIVSIESTSDNPLLQAIPSGEGILDHHHYGTPPPLESTFVSIDRPTVNYFSNHLPRYKSYTRPETKLELNYTQCNIHEFSKSDLALHNPDPFSPPFLEMEPNILAYMGLI